MKLNQDEINDIIAKQETLESIKPQLKAEFKGIDNIIDSIIESIRPFVIFPKSLKRPLIVNLWGMTGIGKTSLINRLVQLLNLQHQYFKFDIGEYAAINNEWKLKQDLSDKIDKCFNKHLIVVFDEFQLGRTIDESGREVDRVTLRPVWDIIDSGIITKIARRSYEPMDILTKLRKCLDSGVVVKNGVVIQGEEVYNSIFRYNVLRRVDFEEYLGSAVNVINDDDFEEDFDEVVTETLSGHGPEYTAISGTSAALLKKPYFIKYDHFLGLYNANPELFNNIQDFNKWMHKFRGTLSGEDIVDYLFEQFIESSPVMTKEDYSQSLIFNIGNIDEAYNMTHSTDPDNNPDEMYEESLKITIPDIKEALSFRYRMEQISRLGNNHLIYPSLNKRAYEEIIDMQLQKRVDDFKVDFEVDLVFDASVKDIIYKESVFPTQGARPVLSSMLVMVDSYLTLLVADLVTTLPEVNRIFWRFNPELSIYEITASDDKTSLELKYPVKLNLETLRQSDYSEFQTVVAVHEAGHTILSIVVDKLLPKEVKSRTASSQNEGLTSVELNEISTKRSLFNSIVVGLGGLTAEKLIFGEENQMVGSVADLQQATFLASKMVKTYGMSDQLHQLSTPENGPNVIYDAQSNQRAEDKVIAIIEEAQNIAEDTMLQYKDFLVELSAYLSKKPSIKKDELREMARKYVNVDELKTRETYYDFQERLASLYNALPQVNFEASEKE